EEIHSACLNLRQLHPEIDLQRVGICRSAAAGAETEEAAETERFFVAKEARFPADTSDFTGRINGRMKIAELIHEAKVAGSFTSQDPAIRVFFPVINELASFSSIL